MQTAFETIEKCIKEKVNITINKNGNFGYGITYHALKGLGKEKYKLIDAKETTTLGLFNNIENNSNKTLIIEYAENLTNDQINILKGAMDGIVHLTTQNINKNSEFSGNIILMNNKSEQDIENSLLSRTFVINF